MLVKKRLLPLYILCMLLVFLACKPKYRQSDQPAIVQFPDQESIYKANQLSIQQNAKDIREKALAMGWILSETGTGVFFQQIGQGKDQTRKIESGDQVLLTYQLCLLDGTFCYSSRFNGIKRFVVEKSEAEGGLHEAIQFLHPGDSALIVIPPYRAFGLAGDGDRIPPGAILVYEIRIDSVARHVKN
jgi:FKBP-type peptidyl-prolyl cis-trans isomerase FkpA